MENPVKRFLETVLLFDRFFSQPQDFHFWGKTSLLSEFKSIKSIITLQVKVFGDALLKSIITG